MPFKLDLFLLWAYTQYPKSVYFFFRQELTFFFINPELLYIVTFKNTFDPILSFVFLLTQDTLFHFGMVENMKFYVYM